MSGATNGTQTWEAALKLHDCVESDVNDDDVWSITSKTGTNMTGTKLLTSIQCNNSIKDVRISRLWLHNNHNSTIATENVKNNSCDQIQIYFNFVKADLVFAIVYKTLNLAIRQTRWTIDVHHHVCIINTTPIFHFLMLQERHPELQTVSSKTITGDVNRSSQYQPMLVLF